MAAGGWPVSWNTCHTFERDNKMYLCSLWSAGDTASFRSLGESFPCFSRKGTHHSHRIPALLKLPKTVEEITGNESVAGRWNKQEGWPKQHWHCCAALVQTLIAIQNVFSTLTMVSVLVENGVRLWNREKVDSQKYNVCHFLFVLLWRRDQLFAVTFHTMIVTVTIAVIFAIVWILLYHNVKKCNCNWVPQSLILTSTATYSLIFPISALLIVQSWYTTLLPQIMFEGLVESTKQTFESIVVHCSSCSKARLSTEQSHSTGKLTVGCIDLERAFVSVFNYKIKQLQHLTVTCHLLRDCLVTFKAVALASITLKQHIAPMTAVLAVQWWQKWKC